MAELTWFFEICLENKLLYTFIDCIISACFLLNSFLLFSKENFSVYADFSCLIVLNPIDNRPVLNIYKFFGDPEPRCFGELTTLYLF